MASAFLPAVFGLLASHGVIAVLSSHTFLAVLAQFLPIHVGWNASDGFFMGLWLRLVWPLTASTFWGHLVLAPLAFFVEGVFSVVPWFALLASRAAW